MKKLFVISLFTLSSSLFTLCTAQYNVLSNFSNSGTDPDGANSLSTLTLSSSGDTLYGMTVYGGKFHQGSIFYITTDGSVYDTLHSFTGGADGAQPSGDVTLSGHMLYGMTYIGGNNNFGTIFSFNLSTGVLKNLLEFPVGNGNAQGDLTLLNGVLYGMGENGGANSAGILFSIQTDGTGYQILHSFGSGADDGESPVGSLTPSPSGDTLYGMAANGGQYSGGNIFYFVINSNVYDTIHNFGPFGSGNDGSLPQGSLTLSGNLLYGMTVGGGVNNDGTIFSMNTNGSNYKNLFSFNGTTGYYPFGEVTLLGNTLYGLASEGGTNSNGVLFSIHTDGTGYDTLHNFNDPYGREPQGGLTLSDTMLYGTTYAGGSNNYGVVFSYNIVNNITANATAANVTCSGLSNGEATANPKGGVSPYTYSWSNGVTSNPTGNVLSAGTYTVTISDIKGSSATTSVTITEPAEVKDTIIIGLNISCNGGTNGNALVAVKGGISPYTYSWSLGGGTAATANGLSAGTYSVTISDSNGCGTTAIITMTQPDAIRDSIVTESTINVSCNGENNGSATMGVKGGTSPYNYSWILGGGTSASASGLSAGTYTIMVSDSHGCSGTTDTVTITQPAAMSVLRDSVADNGANTGVAAVIVSGGTKPYTYSWSPGNETTDTIKGQPAGNNYCCTITDSNGCTQLTCITINSSAGIENINNVPSINIYPDPDNGYFTVSGVTQGQVIELYNYMGQQLLRQLVENNTIMQFDISDQANGIYLIRIQDKNGNVITQKKIVKVQ